MAWVLYYYTPSGPAAGIFVALFGLVTIVHFYQLIRTRTWFMVPFCIGGILEIIGYIGRLLSSLETPDWTKGPYVIQSALILIAPALLAASIYMTLGRIILLLDAEKCSLIRLQWLTKIFVSGDVLSFLMQASGAGVMVANSNPSTGEHIILGGLFVQIIFFGFFMITSMVFEIRIRRNPSRASVELAHVRHRHMVALYITSALILVRSVVRVVGYLQGYDGYLLRHEVFLYVFDALLMLAAMGVLQYTHPSEVNCLLGWSNKYLEKVFQTRRSVSRPAMEMDGMA
ncbi:hypothetical protein N7510_006564 [Penicillium lagena]|uniref:uncharacterized protein n=1 Tax=Penicillium lagena TaxID=94218 RepID=UPI002540E4A5|nr:uncharacterized protein N7510_006564 [Penicillium lagena]KAJ5613370.1 hypothetical protein N7510_006564 [Penicillium lagena]